MHLYRALLLLSSLMFFSACGSGDGGGSDSSSNSESTGPQPRLEAATVSSLCGVYDSQRILAVPRTEPEYVTVEVLNSDAAIITRQEGRLAGEKQLVKFHSITSAGVATLRVLNGMDVLQRELADGALFVSAGKGCDVTFPGGGAGVLGQLYSLDGESMSERMLMEGSAVASTDICDGTTLGQCYTTIGVIPRPPTAIELDVQKVSIPSRCGAIVDGKLQQTVNAAEIVAVEPLSTDTVIITRLLGVDAGKTQLIKLHGLSSDGVSALRQTMGENFIINASAGGAYLVTESNDCRLDLEADGIAAAGQLYTLDGESINEALLAEGYALAAADDCGGDLLATCYLEIQAEAPAEPTPPPPPPPGPKQPDHNEDGPFVEGIIREFLWKPSSERNGNLAVLVNPTNVRVVVTGSRTETLHNHGPSNGRGTTARGSRPGCAYGKNIHVQFYDRRGNTIPVAGGGNGVTIPDGCGRVEFNR